jgi:hypothetical protein
LDNAVPTETSDEGISLCFQAAIEKLDRVEADAEKEKTQIVKELEADAEKEKTQIVKDLAKDLEGKIPTDRISNEIIYQLHGKVSESLIHSCLDEKYDVDPYDGSISSYDTGPF